MAEIAPFGSWSSPITPELLTRGQVGLAAPMLRRGRICWLEARPEEAGRVTLMAAAEGAPLELTPAPFNVRTRAHEYGGGACQIGDGFALAVEFRDQRVYRVAPGAAPVPLTPESGGRLRYADLELDGGRNRALAVREDHRAAGEPVSTIVAFSLAGSTQEGEVLVEGHDFFSAPRLSPDGRRLAWLAWDHPDMPWDSTSLWLAELDADGRLGEARQVAGGPDEALVQPAWSPDGALHVVSDRTGWWNLYRVTADGLAPVCPRAAEFAGPAWTFGQCWYGFLSAETVIASYVEEGESRLGRIELASGALTPLPLPFAEHGDLAVESGRVVLEAGAPDRPAAIVEIDPASGAWQVVRASGELPVASDQLARPLPITFPTTDGGQAYALYYPPCNPAFAAPAGSRPPLIVKSHGGPTSQASRSLSLGIQFWTARGFALCDVDYGGSTGYGRPYRARLNGRWGEVDVEDCVGAARFLVAEGLADERRLAITGGSAGGFTTLAALVFHDLFKAGASHYGVSDLEALARDTHKFESRYLDRLVGPWPEAAALYRARSPIHHVDRLACPVIFFQGLDDKVVPPSQAETMVEALRRKRLPVTYLEFPGEGHGFRQAATIQAVRRAELAFYGRIFGFTPAGPGVDLAIENLG
jgi:dipeptidyl aminopeptidase/acylaminoacyl peptidase